MQIRAIMSSTHFPPFFFRVWVFVAELKYDDWGTTTSGHAQ